MPSSWSLPIVLGVRGSSSKARVGELSGLGSGHRAVELRVSAGASEGARRPKAGGWREVRRLVALGLVILMAPISVAVQPAGPVYQRIG